MFADEPVDRSSVRRFAQAIMDDDPLYWDDEYARNTRYGGVVAPPLFPLHVMRRHAGADDPLDRLEHDPSYDGSTEPALRYGLPDLPIPLPRLLNGGNDIRVYSLARIGEFLASRSRYVEIFEKTGKTGALLFVVIETTYSERESGRVLLKNRQTQIWR